MKIKAKIETEIEVSQIQMTLPIRYEEDEYLKELPCFKNGMVVFRVDIDTGKIIDFPDDVEINVDMKVVDEGIYEIFGPDGGSIKRLEDGYVPNGVIPGEYGDYVDLKISKGHITNWPKNPSLDSFFPDED